VPVSLAWPVRVSLVVMFSVSRLALNSVTPRPLVVATAVCSPLLGCVSPPGNE
jgi:hypothetical protein